MRGTLLQVLPSLRITQIFYKSGDKNSLKMWFHPSKIWLKISPGFKNINHITFQNYSGLLNSKAYQKYLVIIKDCNLEHFTIVLRHRIIIDSKKYFFIFVLNILTQFGCTLMLSCLQFCLIIEAFQRCSHDWKEKILLKLQIKFRPIGPYKICVSN